MPSNRPPPTFEIREIVSLNALDLTVEALEQRLELSYAWLISQSNDMDTHCPSQCTCFGAYCNADNICGSNVCRGGNCPEGPNAS